MSFFSVLLFVQSCRLHFVLFMSL